MAIKRSLESLAKQYLLEEPDMFHRYDCRTEDEYHHLLQQKTWLNLLGLEWLTTNVKEQVHIKRGLFEVVISAVQRDEKRIKIYQTGVYIQWDDTEMLYFLAIFIMGFWDYWLFFVLLSFVCNSLFMKQKQCISLALRKFVKRNPEICLN